MKFRIPESREYNQILQLVQSVLMEYGIDINPEETDKDLSDIEEYYLKNNGFFEVLEKDNQIVGSYGLYPVTKKLCELRKMYLLSSHQGAGFGRMIIERAMAKARELGYETMSLETNSSLNKALKLYKKYGFTEYEPDYFSDRCDLALKRSL